MPIEEIVVPQMGEGLTEVRLLAFLKQPGAAVTRDEPIYSMETDKATMEVESPVSGVIKEWLGQEGEILPVGAPIVRIETQGAAPAGVPRSGHTVDLRPPVAANAQAPAAPAGARIPPRTKQHARTLGIEERVLATIPAASGTLLPADVDRWLAAQTPAPGAVAYQDHPLTPQQRTFVYRMRRSDQTVIPGTIGRPLNWAGIRGVVESRRAADARFRPTDFQTFAYCVAHAVTEHPKLRSTMLNDETVREWQRPNLGIAVARDNGELVTAVVAGADHLSYREFIESAQARIHEARDGKDQADASVQLLLTYMGAFDIVSAVPVLVAPAVAVLFVGAAYEAGGNPTVNLALTFDHRLINGVEAARFLATVVENVAEVERICHE